MASLKGICYQPFPPGYDPSTANTTCIFFGSDIAYDPMEPIWGSQYTSSQGSSCGFQSSCRNDLQVLKNMGVSLIRLYDWEPRNNHQKFLDYCLQLGIQVLVPVSNYFLLGGYSNRQTLIPELITSFSNTDKTDYHPAIYGIIIGNEPEVSGFSAQTCAQFTTDWINIEQNQFSHYRQPKIGHPVDFGKYGGNYPCWGFWDPLFQELANVNIRNLQGRLILTPQTYNDANYLFQNAEGSGQGYVDLTWTRYQKPILFTEIGMDRTKPNYQQVVQQQLQGCFTYNQSHPERLIGPCFFQFADKVWLPQGSSEASFGAYSHSGQNLCTINYGPPDFTHWDANCNNNQMVVDVLTPSPLHDVVVGVYKQN